MQRQHICQSWLSNRVKLSTDYFLSARVFLPKALIAKKLVSQKPTANTVGNARRIRPPLDVIISNEKSWYSCLITVMNFEFLMSFPDLLSILYKWCRHNLLQSLYITFKNSCWLAYKTSSWYKIYTNAKLKFTVFITGCLCLI